MDKQRLRIGVYAVPKGTQKTTDRKLIQASRAAGGFAVCCRRLAFVLAVSVGAFILTPMSTANEGVRFSESQPSRMCRARFDHFSDVVESSRSRDELLQADRKTSTTTLPVATATVSATGAVAFSLATRIAPYRVEPVRQEVAGATPAAGGLPIGNSQSSLSGVVGVELRSFVEPDNLARVLLPLDAHEIGALSDWGDLFEFPVRYDHRPSYLPEPGYLPTIDPSPRPPAATQRPFRQLLDKEIHRQVRRFVKRRWRDQFKADLSMRHSFYRSRVALINQIGRQEGDFDPFNVDQFYNETRNDALNRPGLEGERELMLVEWGPLQLDDHGSFSFNPRAIFDFGSDGTSFFDGPKCSTETIKPAPKNDNQALFRGKFYRLRTKVKLNFNPFRAIRSGDYQDTISSYGGVVEVDFLSDILKRELFATEFEGELKQDGRWGAFFNLVFQARR